jgi:hypothetical protein
MKYWEIIADRLHAQGWSYGVAEHFTKHGLLYCVDAHRDGKRFIVKADDLLTAFLSLEKDAIAQKAVTATGRAKARLHQSGSGGSGDAAGVATGDDEEVELLAAAASYFSSRVFCF